MHLLCGNKEIQVPDSLASSASVVERDFRKENETHPTIDDLLNQALDNPVHADSFSRASAHKNRIGIVVPDITRPAVSRHILPLIVTRLNSMSYSDDQITVFFARGIHRHHTDVEQRYLLGDELAGRIRCRDHNAYAERNYFCHLGTTRAGTPVIVNKELLDHDGIILLGSSSFHYFAGYGGGRKLLIPGMAAFKTCRANHLLLLDEDGNRRPGIAPGYLRWNPIHLDMLEAAAYVSPDFCINVIVDTHNTIEHIIAGHWCSSHEHACHYLFKKHSFPVEHRFDVVLVSCGGSPRDINFIQAHKALEMGFMLTGKGGTLVLVAECPDGMGHPELASWFEYENLAEMHANLVENYHIYGQTAYATRMKSSDTDILLYSQLDDAMVEKMGMIPIASLEGAECFIHEKHGKKFSGAILPHGAQILPVQLH